MSATQLFLPLEASVRTSAHRETHKACVKSKGQKIVATDRGLPQMEYDRYGSDMRTATVSGAQSCMPVSQASCAHSLTGLYVGKAT